MTYREQLDVECSQLSVSFLTPAILQMYYNPAEVTYEQLLDVFFQRVDPTTLNRQGNDAGTQYRSSIYYHSEAQKEAAEKVGLGNSKA